MNETVTFSHCDATPAKGAVYALQGIPPDADIPKRIESMCEAAYQLLAQSAEPAGLVREISVSDFARVYEGEGNNDVRTPVGEIFPDASQLALYVVTIGPRTCAAITEGFDAGDYALASMLDSVASAAADRLSETMASRFLEHLWRGGRANASTRVLGYSPGYCGWHISGQKRLFEHLQPGQIGVMLRDSFLMEPLKSVSGVLIAGPRELHDISTDYPCCGECEPQGCRERVRALAVD
jgi:hypothetical protein